MNADKVFSVRLSKEILEAFEEVARERKRKRGDVIREALEIYLENWADYQVAVDRLRDSGDSVLTEEELFDKLGWTV